jgi:hypothetical protein
MMQMKKLGNGKIVIKGDEALLAKIEGQSLAGVDISDLRVNADTLAELYSIASAAPTTNFYSAASGTRVLIKTQDNIKRYAVMKQKYLDTFDK